MMGLSGIKINVILLALLLKKITAIIITSGSFTKFCTHPRKVKHVVLSALEFHDKLMKETSADRLQRSLSADVCCFLCSQRRLAPDSPELYIFTKSPKRRVEWTHDLLNKTSVVVNFAFFCA